MFLFFKYSTLYDVGNRELDFVSSLFFNLVCTICEIAPISDDERQSNPVASTPKAPSKSNTVCHIFLFFSFSRLFELLLILYSISFFWHYLAVLCVRNV